MTEAMPFLQKAILLSYAPRPLDREYFLTVKMRFYLSLTASRALAAMPSALSPK